MNNRVDELERVLENILELFEATGNSYIVETITGELIEVSKPLCDELDAAELVLYAEGVDGPDGSY